MKLVCALLAAPLLLTGCATLLPVATSDATIAFESFEAAQRAFEGIEADKTTVGELGRMGFDTADSRNVTLIPYPNLVSRLAPNANIATADLEPGLRECILARKACTAYEFQFAREARRRSGNFVLDFLNFSRTTTVTGWRFDALVVVRDGVVLFSNFGGEPNIHRVERRVNPLGPLQATGEAISGNLLR